MSTKKTVSIDRYYPTAGRCDLEARQYINYPDTINQITPKPADWQIKASIVKAESYHNKGPNGKSILRLIVECEGAEPRIDEWAENYRKTHGSFANVDEAVEKHGLQKAQAAARKKQSLYKEIEHLKLEAKEKEQAGDYKGSRELMAQYNEKAAEIEAQS